MKTNASNRAENLSTFNSLLLKKCIKNKYHGVHPVLVNRLGRAFSNVFSKHKPQLGNDLKTHAKAAETGGRTKFI